MSPPKKPMPKTDSDELSDLWPKISLPTRQWIEQAALNLIASPLPVRLLLEKLQLDANLQPDGNRLLQDVNLNVGDKVMLYLMLVVKKMDADIEAQAARATPKPGGTTNIDLEMQNLRRLMDKRNQMLDMMSKIMDQYSNAAKDMVRNMGG